MTFDCFEDSYVEIKCPLSTNYIKTLDYLYKSVSEIKLKANHSYFTQSVLEMAVTIRKFYHFVVSSPSFDGIMWKDIKEKLIAF